MPEDTYSFEQARVRLEEIASQVRRKDISLEKSLDLLEEGVRLANLCTEQIDHTQWKSAVADAAAASDDAPEVVGSGSADASGIVSDSGFAESPEQPAAPASSEPDGTSSVSSDASSAPCEGDGGSAALCEPEHAGADSAGDVPSEDSHGAAEDAPPEDPDVEA